MVRELTLSMPACIKTLRQFYQPTFIMPGIIALQTNPFSDYATAEKELEFLNQQLKNELKFLKEIPFIILSNDVHSVADCFNNFLWTTFTKCNPTHDLYGIDSFTNHKHWGCNGPLVFDARQKPHHAPPLEKIPAIEKNIERLFNKGASLYGILK